jgi:hypothetical protein
LTARLLEIWYLEGRGAFTDDERGQPSDGSVAHRRTRRELPWACEAGFHDFH